MECFAKSNFQIEQKQIEYEINEDWDFKSFALLLVTYYPTSVHGQIIDTERYHRASLISMLIERPMYPFNDEISDAFKTVPMPNRFNNHNLGVRIVRFATQEYTSQEEHIEQFIEKSFLSNRAIAKWFDWNKEDGSFLWIL